jgi:hypothetical protein
VEGPKYTYTLKAHDDILLQCELNKSTGEVQILSAQYVIEGEEYVKRLAPMMKGTYSISLEEGVKLELHPVDEELTPEQQEQLYIRVELTITRDTVEYTDLLSCTAEEFSAIEEVLENLISSFMAPDYEEIPYDDAGPDGETVIA